MTVQELIDRLSKLSETAKQKPVVFADAFDGMSEPFVYHGDNAVYLTAGKHIEPIYDNDDN